MKHKGMKKGLAVLAAAVVLAVLLAGGCFFRVGQGEEAIVLTFGRVTDTKGPGLYWKLPVIQSVIKESVTTIHTKEYGYRTTQAGSAGNAAQYEDVLDESVMLTNDDSIVSIEAVYQYTIRNVQEYAFDIDDPEGTLRNGNSGNESARTDRRAGNRQYGRASGVRQGDDYGSGQ